MKWTQIQGHWKEIAGLVRGTWGELTNDDLVVAEGQADLLIGRVMARYGMSKDGAQRQVQAWADRLEQQLIVAEISTYAELAGDPERWSYDGPLSSQVTGRR